MDSRYVRRLGEARCGRDEGTVGTFDRLARAGLPFPEGILLTREAHRRFFESSGLSEDIEISARQGRTTRRQVLCLRRRYREEPLERDLGRCISGALLDLGARTVMVHSEERSEGGLGTIPAVYAAVRRAWLSTEGLKRQVEAAYRDERIPTWPVLIQREVGCGPRTGASPSA